MARRSGETDVYRDGSVHVCKRMCATCIFRPGNLMNLTEGRVEQLVAEATASDSCITCHSTLGEEHQAVCRGFFDRHKPPLLQVAERLGIIAYDEPIDT